MLYEVGVDALESLEGATNVSVFRYTRNYQYVLIFNRQVPLFQSTDVRRALSMAIDRASLIKDAFDGHAEASVGPISPRHWAFGPDLPAFSYEPRSAARLLASAVKPRRSALTFVCLVPHELERLALVVKRQLEMVGVTMDVRETSPDQFLDAFLKHDYDAVLSEFISGPTMFRLYEFWHSQGTLRGNAGSPVLDAALDRLRQATDDGEYRAAVAGLQKATIDDPPGIFLAWSQRARAISRRFEARPEEGRDILGTIRLWRPSTGQPLESRH